MQSGPTFDRQLYSWYVWVLLTQAVGHDMDTLQGGVIQV
jgi:hypothetical protein